MPLFRYKAFSPAGDAIDGAMEAASAEEVIAKLQDAGNLPVEAKPADSVHGGGLFGLFGRRAELNAEQVLLFTQQLATLLGAGQPLDRALQILLDLPDSEGARKLIERVRDEVRGGAPLSSAPLSSVTVLPEAEKSHPPRARRERVCLFMGTPSDARGPSSLRRTAPEWCSRGSTSKGPTPKDCPARVGRRSALWPCSSRRRAM